LSDRPRQILLLDEWSLVATDQALTCVARKTYDRVEAKAAELMAALGGAMKDTRVLSIREAAKARTRAQALEAVGLVELSLSGATEVGGAWGEARPNLHA
jgi:hypothetical protein